MEIKNIIKLIQENLGVNNTFYIIPVYEKNEKGENILSEITIKQLKNNVSTTTFSLSDIDRLSSGKLKVEDLMYLFKNKGTYIYKDYVISLWDIVEVRKRKNNWLIQSIYKSWDKKDIIDYFNPYWLNIITWDYTTEAIADVIDLIWDNSFLIALYNMNKRKPIFEELDDNADLSLIKSQYKKIVENYQEVFNNFKIIFNNSSINFKETYFENDKTLFDNSSNIATLIKKEADLGIHDADLLTSTDNINYNSLIWFNWDLLSVLNDIKDIVADSIYKNATIVNIKTINFVNKWYIVDIYRYKKDVKEYVHLYSNKLWLASLIEERLAQQFNADSRLKAQWGNLRKTLLDK